MKRFALLIVLGSLLTMQYGCGHRRACCRCYNCCYTAPYLAPDQEQPEPVAAEPVEAEQEEYDVAFQPDDLQLNQPVLPHQYY